MGGTVAKGIMYWIKFVLILALRRCPCAFRHDALGAGMQAVMYSAHQTGAVIKSAVAFSVAACT